MRVLPAGDDIPAKRASAEALDLVTDATGSVRFKPGTRSHMQLVLPEGLPLTHGGLVPDTCRKATISVPAVGKMTFIVTMDKDARVPPMIVAEHAAARA